jgi:hypothetical protein
MGQNHKLIKINLSEASPQQVSDWLSAIKKLLAQKKVWVRAKKPKLAKSV